MIGLESKIKDTMTLSTPKTACYILKRFSKSNKGRGGVHHGHHGLAGAIQWKI